MPLYEYQCNNCKEAFEQIVRFSEADLTPACPFCGDKDTRKKISKVASFGSSSSGSATSSGSNCGSSGGFT
jgi:putative FmdB family regulatory protein